MANYRDNLVQYKRQYEPGYEIPKGFHVHHIVPQALGGSDEGPNLIALHPDDHLSIHQHRGDKCAREGWWIPRSQKGELNGFYGKKHRADTKKHISKKLMGNQHLKDHVHRAESIDKIRAAADRETRICPHCGKHGKGKIMFRWHFDNCKEKN